MTDKEIDGIVTGFIVGDLGGDLKNPRRLASLDEFHEAVPLIMRLELEKKIAYARARRIGLVLEALTNSAGVYAADHECALDTPLEEIRSDVYSAVFEIDGEDYRFTRSVGDPKRTDGGAVTQDFLGRLPVTWTKTVETLAPDKEFLKTLSPSLLRSNGLYLPDKYTFKEGVGL